MKLNLLVASLLPLAAFTTKVSSQHLFYKIGSASPIPLTANQSAEINVGTLPADSTTLLRIYDDQASATSRATQSLGRITIRGEASPRARLKLIIAGFSVPEFIEGDPVLGNATDPRLLMLEGLVNLGEMGAGGVGIEVTGPIGNLGDTSLRDATALALSTIGDIRGSIDVGRVFRIESGQNAVAPTGLISSNITTHRHASGENFWDDAIVMIVAGNGITGTVKAEGAETYIVGNDTFIRQASIGRIAVGPLTCTSGVCPIGVQGHILAQDGHIGQVYTTGPIGHPATSAQDTGIVNIWAGAGVYEVRAVKEEAAWFESRHPSVPLAVDLHADIKANWGYPMRPGLGRLSNNDAAFRLVQTHGKFRGAISAGNVTPAARFLRDPQTRAILINANTLMPEIAPIHSGLLVLGVMDAPITIDYKLDNCDLMASNFPRPIIIGLSAEGSIVAHGRDDRNAPVTQPPKGYVQSIEIGYADIPVNDIEYHKPRGYIGAGTERHLWPCQRSGCVPPISANEPEFCALLEDWELGYSPVVWMYSVLAEETIPGSLVGGSVDTVIRAEQIDSLRLRQMRTLKGPPRVEANLIGLLDIGDLREGAIWSGNYELRRDAGVAFSPCMIGLPGGNPDEINALRRACAYNPADDYTSIVYSNIGCMGTQGHVWYKDCPYFRVQRSCLGGIHVPALNVGQMIWIGDRLGRRDDDDTQAYCDCLGNEPPAVIGGDTAHPFECISRCGQDQQNCRDFGGTFASSTLPSHPLHLITNSGNDPLRMALISVGDHLGTPGSTSGDRTIHGQIIINGANHPPIIDDPSGTPVVIPRWKGKVTTGPTLPRDSTTQTGNPPCNLNDPTPIPQVVLRPLLQGNDPNPSMVAPYYKELPQALGYGSIGEAPFHLHERACEPIHMFAVSLGDRADTTITSSSFYQLGTQIKIRNYGPIRTRLVNGVRKTWQASVRIDAVSETPGDECRSTDMTSMFTVHGPGDSGWTGDDRTITLSAGQYLSPFPGVYRVVPVHVVCAEVKDEPDVVWPEECDGAVRGAYRFRIAPDCNRNLLNDYAEIRDHPDLDLNPMDGNIDGCQMSQSEKCRADFNRSGMVSAQDIFDFLSNWFIQCPGPSNPLGSPCFATADFNHSGTINVQDIFDFLTNWFMAGATNCQ